MAENQTRVPPPIEPPPASIPPLPPPNLDSQARTWNMLCHLSALAACLGVPFGNILGPLIVWQIKKAEFPSVDLHGKAALNFQIMITIATLISGSVAFVLAMFCIGALLIPLVGLVFLAGLVFAVIAGIKANNGEDYKYPYSIDFVK